MIHLDILRNIVSAYGPSGREETVRETIRRYAAPLCDRVYTDALGNLIAYKKGTSGKKVMLSAHMDQIGFAVVDIDDKGFARIAPVGGVSAGYSLARPVVFENGTQGILYREVDGVDAKSYTVANLFIDIGAKDRAEAETKVKIGDMAVYAPYWQQMGSKVSCAALDNRACCAVMLEVLAQAQPVHDLYAVFTVQEEVGCRGAKVAAYAIEPDFGLNFDVTGHGDTPKADPLPLRLGEGAAIKVMDRSVIVPQRVRLFLEACAEEIKTPFQREVLPYGGTDTSAVQTSRGGIPAACISIPCRYVHAPHEVVDLDDLQAAVDIACQALSKQALPVD